MIIWYRWLRRGAYIFAGVGLLFLFLSRSVGEPHAERWGVVAFAMLAVFSILLFLSYALFVVIKMQRQKERLRGAPSLTRGSSLFTSEAKDKGE